MSTRFRHLNPFAEGRRRLVFLELVLEEVHQAVTELRAEVALLRTERHDRGYS